MAERNGFFLYLDQHAPIADLTLEQKGMLLDAMFAFNAGEPFALTDPVVRVAFGFFKASFQREQQKYAEICKRRKAAAKSRWDANEPNASDAMHAMQMHANASDAMQTMPKPEPEQEQEEENTLSPEDSLENEDHARAKGAAGESEKLFPVQTAQDTASANENRIGIASDPSIDFQELRQFYSEHFRAEGPLAGFTEYRQLRASTTFPGFSRLYEDLKARLDCRCWDKGFAPGLGKYLREHTWRAPIQARASPHPATPTEYQRQQQDRREMMRMALQFRGHEGHEHAANEGREVQHGQRATAATAVAEIG